MFQCVSSTIPTLTFNPGPITESKPNIKPDHNPNPTLHLYQNDARPNIITASFAKENVRYPSIEIQEPFV